MKRFLTAFMRRLTGSQAAGTATSPTPDTTGMLDCESVMRQLWDYLDGELTDDRKAAVRTHLELCRRCHPQYEFEQSFLDAIGASAPAHSNPDRLRARLLAALADEGFEAR